MWGNKCDLSFSNGLVEAAQDPFELLKLFEPNILSDHSKEVWNAVSDLTTESQIIGKKRMFFVQYTNYFF